MEDVHLDLGTVRLHGVAVGEGPLVLMLHGFPEFWYSWRHQLPVLGRTFRAVALDLRGYNGSDAPGRVEDYRTAALVGDVVQAIEALGYGKAHLVGHDWGGVLAWMTASRHPERVERLAVLNAPHPEAMKRRLRKDWRQLLRSSYMLAFQVPGLPERLVLANPGRAMAMTLRGTARVPEAFSQEDLDRYAEAIARPGRARAALNYYRAAARGLLASRGDCPRRIQCPTLILWGACDHALRPRLLHDSMEYVEGDCDAELLPATGHWLQQERPGEVSDRLLRFLS